MTPTFYLFRDGKFYEFGHVRARRVEDFGRFIYKESKEEFGIVIMPTGNDAC